MGTHVPINACCGSCLTYSKDTSFDYDNSRRPSWPIYYILKRVSKSLTIGHCAHCCCCLYSLVIPVCPTTITETRPRIGRRQAKDSRAWRYCCIQSPLVWGHKCVSKNVLHPHGLDILLQSDPCHLLLDLYICCCA